MNLVSLVCLLACSSSMMDWTSAFPIAHQDLRGDVSTEPNVVMQSVVVGKKEPDHDVLYNRDDCECPKFAFGNMNIMLRKLFHFLQPDLLRFKRNDKKTESESFDEKTIERLIDAIEDWKQDNEKKKDIDIEDIRDFEEELRRARTEARKMARDDAEAGQRRWRKRESDFPRDKKERRWKKALYKKRQEQERRRADLADSWPRRTSEDKNGDDFYLPLPYHHQPSHHRLTEYLP